MLDRRRRVHDLRQTVNTGRMGRTVAHDDSSHFDFAHNHRHHLDDCSNNDGAHHCSHHHSSNNDGAHHCSHHHSSNNDGAHHCSHHHCSHDDCSNNDSSHFDFAHNHSHHLDDSGRGGMLDRQQRVHDLRQTVNTGGMGRTVAHHLDNSAGQLPIPVDAASSVGNL